MPQDVNQDVTSLREWLAKESYLPQDFSDFVLQKFLHSCYGSLEKTKKCIDRFSTGRGAMPELYTSRDPCTPNMKTAFSITAIGMYKAGEIEVLIHQVDDPTLDHYNFYDVLKAFSLESDYHLKTRDFFPEGHVIIFDMKSYSLKIITKINVMFFRDFLVYLLEAMPIRLKQIHVINCPSYYEKLYALVKPALPEDIRNIMKFHSTAECLHKFIDKQYLPLEFGGGAQSLKEQHRHWVERISENRKEYLNDNMWKADLKMKPKSSSVENTMNGSFRTLSID